MFRLLRMGLASVRWVMVGLGWYNGKWCWVVLWWGAEAWCDGKWWEGKLWFGYTELELHVKEGNNPA